MINFASIDGLLDKAFQLACFIHGDRETALRIVVRALARLEVAAAAQRKRLYYRPAGRSWPRPPESDRFRNNVSFDETHLLQRLIYIESEPHEIAREQGRGSTPASEEDLVIHFVKYLVRTTAKRNSFYVTLGLSRLLYSYATAETMDIYNAVIQDPERVKDDYYYRSRKGVLMQELKGRFGDLINVCRGPRGEERFQADDNQHRFVGLVRECLSFFTPWHTPCLVPAGVDPITDGIPPLSYSGHEEEDKVEVNRIHAVIHPDCFRRLLADLRLDAPDNRLGVPRFFYANDMNDTGPRGDRRRAAKLKEEELTSIQDELDKAAARRKAAIAGLLRVVVDGVERARFDLDETRGARFGLDEDAELIEVRARDDAGEELLLTSYLLAHTDTESGIRPAAASIILEGGQKISIVVSPAPGETGATVDITYRETNPLRAASRLLHQLKRSVSGGPSRSIWNERKILVPALAFLLLAACFGVVIRYALKGNERAAEQNQVAAARQNGPVNEGETRAQQGAATDNGASSAAGETTIAGSSNAESGRKPQGANVTNQSTNSTTPRQVAEARRPPETVGPPAKTENTARNSAQEKPDNATPREAGAEISTRSVAAVPAAVPLSAVKKIYVETVGDEVSSRSVRRMLGERLRAGGRITLARNRDEADALLRVSVTKSATAEPEAVNVLVQLIDARGEVVWPVANSGGEYQGSVAGVSAGVVKDLLAAIRKAGRRR